MKDVLKKSLIIFLIEELSSEIEECNKQCFFHAFKKYFKDRSEFDTALKKLNKDTSKIIKLGAFYHRITKEIKHAGVTLISIFSIMEATAPDEFITFDQWLLGKIKSDENILIPSDRDSFKDVIHLFQKKYFKKHGSSERVRTFVYKYFCAEDKQKLINGFQIKDKDKRIAFESIEFNEKIKAIIDMLYNERNAFVHQARLPQISNQQVKMLGHLKIKNKYMNVSIKIPINEIQEMFERAFVKYLREKCA